MIGNTLLLFEGTDGLILCCGGLIVLGGLAFVAVTYNRLVTLRNRVSNQWAQIDVQLKRRYDLIPNLVETVKGYMKHEQTVLENVTKYRAMIVTGTPGEKAAANNMLTQSLKSLFAVAESYPKLEASDQFKMLQEELSGTENKISYIRTAYNDAVTEFNTACDVFPTNLIANLLGFKHAVFYEVADAERQNVQVKFQ